MRILPGLFFTLLTGATLLAPASAKAPPHAKTVPASSDAVFSLQTADGSTKTYRFQIPVSAAPSKTTVSQQQATLAALYWARNYYQASNVTADQIEYRTTPGPHYLVHLTGKIGSAREKLLAAVLADGKIVRPSEATASGKSHPAKVQSR